MPAPAAAKQLRPHSATKLRRRIFTPSRIHHLICMLNACFLEAAASGIAIQGRAGGLITADMRMPDELTAPLCV